MTTTSLPAPDLDATLEHLSDQGYAVVENVLNKRQLEEIRTVIDELMAKERETPFEPEDGPPSSDDAAIEKFFTDSYTVS